MFIAVNKLGGPHGHTHGSQAIIENFRRALASMKQFQGFLGLEIWTAEDGSMQGVSRWTSKEAMDEYLNSSLFKQHHGGAEGQQSSAHTLYYTAQVLE